MNPAKPTPRRSPLPKRGVLPPRQVRKLLFAMSSVCVLACVVVSILAIWDYVGNDAAFKMLASCGVLIGGGMLFELLNARFGEPQSAGTGMTPAGSE